MSQSSSLASAITSNRWSADETLFFIGLLFELRVEKGPNSDNSIYTREAFQDILVKLNAQYPEFTYELETLERKYQYFRKLWAVFTDAKKLKGTTWDSCTGRVAMNRENEAKIIERHGQYGRRVVICGLIVGHGVTIETWKEIFQPSGVPLGRYIREAGDAVGFAQARAEARATRAAARKRKRTPENNEATDSLPAFSGLVGKGEREQPPSQSRRSSRMSGSSSSGTAAKRPRNEEEPTPLQRVICEITTKLLSNDKPRTYVHIIPSRIEGPVDTEKALHSCFALTEERGTAFVNKLADWIRQDPMNVLTWNALPSKEARDAWLAHIIKEDL